MQGVAEVYPVSSSAQLTLLPRLLDWTPVEDRTRFAAGLHAGSAVGLAVALRHEVRAADLPRVALASLPAAAAGYLAHDAVERRLGRPGTTAALLAGAGIAMWLADRRPAVRREAGPTDVLAAAVAQVPALAPGVSRQGAVLTALRWRGVERSEAQRLSLLMSLPVAGGAAALTAVRGRQLPPLVPSVLAGVGAYAAARTRPVSRRYVGLSVAYRLVVAVATLRKKAR